MNPSHRKNRKHRKGKQKPSTPSVQLWGNGAEWDRLGAELKTTIQTEGVNRVTRLRRAIANDAKLPMPPIRIEPYGWEMPNKRGVVFAQAATIFIKDAWQLGVIIPASTLIVIDDDVLLRRLLCHEFAHCFWLAEQAFREESKTFTIEIDGKHPDWHELVNPRYWFGEWDVKHFLVSETALVKAAKNFKERWVKQKLPTKEGGGKWEASGTFGFPDKIVAHIHKLNNTQER